ncbi:effector-associated domain EAD1-containing protein [Pseudofrankia sp. BMG5.37]|uniref:effector-associated domain EAD1-containing protein n=1 Tax=Pseudofrankia sp. BMG5.37 TaxID=3050035 RepID=UPI00289425CF|nr:effector-associated domain EAD1-containing protein [Pseudofrankia sp. BMG5.37]MDT3441035.1 effector-associated domain EAD1-containing protein [Pseudofrankia sp. BMG5.37]
MNEPLTHEEIDELADLRHQEEPAKQLLGRAGFGRRIQPVWGGSSMVFWRSVSALAEDGAVKDGRRRIIAEAAALFPANPVFAWAALPEPPDGTTGEGQAAVWNRLPVRELVDRFAAEHPDDIASNIRAARLERAVALLAHKDVESAKAAAVLDAVISEELEEPASGGAAESWVATVIARMDPNVAGKIVEAAPSELGDFLQQALTATAAIKKLRLRRQAPTTPWLTALRPRRHPGWVFFRNYPDGVVFWSEAAGNMPVDGEIGQVWVNNGGLEGGLRLPTSPELDAAGSSGTPEGGHYQRFEWWQDYTEPVAPQLPEHGGPCGAAIYYSKQHGAHAIWGAIGQLYEHLQGTSGPLGFPVSGEIDGRPGGKGPWRCYQRFEGGAIFYLGENLEHRSVPMFGAAARLVTGNADVLKKLGFPVAERVEVTSPRKTAGYGQKFERGAVYWTESGGAFPVRGAFAESLDAAGGVADRLGFPLSEILPAAESRGAWGTTDGYLQRYEGRFRYNLAVQRRVSAGARCGATIYHSGHGTFWVRGNIGSCYELLGGTTSELGFPTAREEWPGDRCWQRFEGGAIFWSREYGGIPLTGAVWHLLDPLGSAMSAEIFNRCGFPLAGPQRLRTSSADVIQQFEGAVVTVTDDQAELWPRPTAIQAKHRLESGEELHVDESLFVAGHRLTLQGDRNLALYHFDGIIDKNAAWASDTQGKPVVKLLLESSGNLALYDAEGNQHWESGTVGNPGAVLILQDDGLLTLRGVDDTVLKSWP